MESELFEDVHAMVSISQALVPNNESPARPTVTAIERGTRQHPDGTTVAYERVEFNEERSP